MLERIDNPRSNENIWIATSPFSAYELEKRGINYHIPEEFFSSEALMDICYQSFECIQNIVKVGDKFLNEEILEIKEKKLTPFLYRFHQLFMVHSAAMSRIFQIYKIIEQIRPDELWTHTSKEYPFGIYDFCFNKKDALWGRLLELRGWKNLGIKIAILSEVDSPEEGKNDLSGNLLKDIIRSLYRLPSKKLVWLDILRPFYPERSFDYKRILLLFRVFKNQFFKNEKHILFLFPYDDWAHCFQLFLNKSCKIAFFPRNLKLESSKTFKNDHLIQALEENELFKKNFRLKEVNFYPFLKSRIVRILEEARGYIEIYDKSHKFFKKFKPDAVCTSTKTSLINFVATCLAKNSGIPVFLWQHGALGTHIHLTIPYLDLVNTSHYLVYGKGVANSFKKESQKFGSSVISVGSTLIDKIAKLEPKLKDIPIHMKDWIARANSLNNRIVLYVTTNLFEHNWYGSYEPPFSDHHFVVSQKKLLNGLSQIYGAKAIIKLHANPEYSLPPWVDEWKYKENMLMIKTEVSIPILLHFVDIILVDWPSTTLLEGLTTRKPIFVLTRWLKFRCDAYALLKKRVICADREEKIISFLSRFIKNNHYAADVNNDEYLKAYGTYLNDGKSAERAVYKVLENIAR